MEDSKNENVEEQSNDNESEATLTEEELDLIAFILREQERPLHSGL